MMMLLLLLLSRLFGAAFQRSRQLGVRMAALVQGLCSTAVLRVRGR